MILITIHSLLTGPHKMIWIYVCVTKTLWQLITLDSFCTRRSKEEAATLRSALFMRWFYLRIYLFDFSKILYFKCI